METAIKHCLSCGKVIRGRIDKKYCDDFCRNNYNNRQKSNQNNYIRNVNNILRKNRRILEDLLQSQEGTRKIQREKLIIEGFNFKYQTHQYQTKRGDIYIFNYEYGYLALANDWLLIVKRQEEKENSQ